MMPPQPSWNDPVHQTALRALIRAGAIPYLFGPAETHWMLDASRTIVLIRLDDGIANADVATLVDERLRRFPNGGVDLVVVGGDAALCEVIEGARPMTVGKSLGSVHVSERGEIRAKKANGALEKALKEAFAHGVPEAVPAETIAAELDEAEVAGRGRLEALRSFSKSLQAGQPRATMILLAVMAAIFAMELAFGRASLPVVVRMGACVAARVKHGEVWRLLSYALLHGSAQHILFNGISLFSLGVFYERLLGTGRFLVLFVLASIGGGIASTLFSPAVMVGASGGLCGLLGAAGALALRPGELLPQDFLPAFRRNTGTNMVLLVMASMLPNVSAAAHVGGGVVGFALMISGVLVPRKDASGKTYSWFAPGAIAVALLAASFGLAMVRGTPWKSGAWGRAVLPGTTLSADMPGAVRVVSRRDGVREYEAGDVLEDGFIVSVLVSATNEPLETPETRVEAARGVMQRGLGRPPGTQPAGGATLTEVGGYPVVTQDARAANGAQFRNWLQVRRVSVVSVQLISRPDASVETQDAPRRILASLRGDE